MQPIINIMSRYMYSLYNTYVPAHLAVIFNGILTILQVILGPTLHFSKLACSVQLVAKLTNP